MVQKVIITHSWYIRHPKVIILKIRCLGLIPNCCNWFLSAPGTTQQICAQAECKVNFWHWLLVFKHELCFLWMLCLKFILLWPFSELSAKSEYKESKARSDKIYLKHPEWILTGSILQHYSALLWAGPSAGVLPRISSSDALSQVKMSFLQLPPTTIL